VKLSVSNIAWPLECDAMALDLMRRACISAVEVAPTRIWPQWQGVSSASAADAAQRLAGYGFHVSSMQALLFGKPDCQLLGSEEQRRAMFDHLAVCADLATGLGAKSLVFGAPKNRTLCGRTEGEAFHIAREFFRACGRLYAERGLCLCLEANPSEYGCEFITNSTQAAQLVRAVDCQGFRLHLDTGCMQMSHEDPVQTIRLNADILQHFHVSEPFLESIEGATCNHPHIGEALCEVDYAGWVTLEMRAGEQSLAALAGSLDIFVKGYAPEAVN
jgi:D-psicose/D-tagatose/L-ribulose 3-epimerase